MVASARALWSRIHPGPEVLPPTLIIALGYPGLGAATLAVTLGFSALLSWMQQTIHPGAAEGFVVLRQGRHEHGR